MFEYVVANDLAGLQTCLARDPLVNRVKYTGEYVGCTPLHVAARLGHCAIVECLVAYHANVHAENLEQWTPLHCACAGGHMDVAKILLASGALLYSTTYEDEFHTWYPLDVARENDHGEFADELATFATEHCIRFPRPLSAMNDPLFDYVLANDAAGVARRIEEGADPNMLCFHENHMCKTPMYIACEVGSLDAAKTLLYHGADLFSDVSGNAPLDAAYVYEHLEFAEQLVLAALGLFESVDFVEALHIACCYDHLPVVRALLGDALLDAYRVYWGETPLHTAARLGNAQTVRYLARRCARDVNALDQSGDTPLHRACVKHHTHRYLYRQMSDEDYLGVAVALVEAGADVHARSAGGDTPLDYARRFMNRALEEYLK